MILQERDGGLMFFRQTDHALLSGEFAIAWGNDQIPAPARREATIVAAARHDDGWAEWELAPKLRGDGDPVDFIRVPVSDHVTLYRRGIDLVAEEDEYAGLLASLHGQRLYTRPFHPGMDPRIEHLQGPDLDLATGYVEGERARQEAIVGLLGPDALEEAEEGWRLLQVWDRLSLFACMVPLDKDGQQTFPAIASTKGDVQITARVSAPCEISLDPYPFAKPDAAFDIAYVRTQARRWDDEATFRRDFRSAPRATLRFHCVSDERATMAPDGP